MDSGNLTKIELRALTLMFLWKSPKNRLNPSSKSLKMENGTKSHFQNLNSLPRLLLFAIANIHTRSRSINFHCPDLTLRDRGYSHAIAKYRILSSTRSHRANAWPPLLVRYSTRTWPSSRVREWQNIKATGSHLTSRDCEAQNSAALN